MVKEISSHDNTDTLTIKLDFRFPHEPTSSENNQNFEQDRIMGIPNKDCDDGKVLINQFNALFFHLKLY